MRLSNQSVKDLGAIMTKYSNADRGFYKTDLPLAEMFSNGNPVSRSEAKRLCAVISRF